MNISVLFIRHAHTKGLPWGLPEFVVTVQQVHCSRRRLLRRGLEFHVCTINKSAHTKKVWKLIVCSSYIYIYIILVYFGAEPGIRSKFNSLCREDKLFFYICLYIIETYVSGDLQLKISSDFHFQIVSFYKKRITSYILYVLFLSFNMLRVNKFFWLEMISIIEFQVIFC